MTITTRTVLACDHLGCRTEPRVIGAGESVGAVIGAHRAALAGWQINYSGTARDLCPFRAATLTPTPTTTGPADRPRTPPPPA